MHEFETAKILEAINPNLARTTGTRSVWLAKNPLAVATIQTGRQHCFDSLRRGSRPQKPTWLKWLSTGRQDRFCDVLARLGICQHPRK